MKKDIKIKSYKIKIFIPPENNLIRIITHVKISSLQNKLNNIFLYLNSNFQINSVIDIHKRNLNFIFKKSKLFIHLACELEKYSITTIIIEYFFYRESLNSIIEKNNIWLRYGSLWYPVPEYIQFSSFKCIACVPKGYEFITNGELIRTIKKIKSTIFIWEEKKMIARFCLILGKYQKKEKIIKKIRLSIYYYSDVSEELLKKYIDRTKKIIDFYNKSFCEYSFRYLKIAEISDDYKCNYSDSSLIMLNNNSFLSNTENILAHEISHQWWGNLIIFSDDSGEIFNESLSEFSWLLYFESLFNKKLIDDYIIKLISIRQEKTEIKESFYRILDQEIKNISLFNNMMKTLGKAKFNELFKKTMNKYSFKVIKEKDFISNIKKEANKSL